MERRPQDALGARIVFTMYFSFVDPHGSFVGNLDDFNPTKCTYTVLWTLRLAFLRGYLSASYSVRQRLFGGCLGDDRSECFYCPVDIMGYVSPDSQARVVCWDL